MSKESLLVLEDDDNLRDLLVDTLEDVGFFVQGAASGDEAVALARRVKFDLVISDVRMDGSMDGLGALEHIKRIRPEVRSIVITGYANDTAPVRAMQVQVDDYVYKPLRLPVLVETARRVLRSADERSWLKGIYNVVNKAKQILQSALHERDKVHQAFFVGIRSGLLNKSIAMEIFDQIVEMESKDGIDPKPILERMQLAARTQKAGNPKPRASGQVTWAEFSRLYDRVKNGEVTAEQLKLSYSLYKLPAVAPSEAVELRHKLWGG